MGFSEVTQLKVSKLNFLALAMKKLDAEEQLKSMQAADFPWMEKDNKQKVHREWTKMHKPEEFSTDDTKIISVKDIAKALSRK